jgi:hypothetical protein
MIADALSRYSQLRTGNRRHGTLSFVKTFTIEPLAEKLRKNKLGGASLDSLWSFKHHIQDNGCSEIGRRRA